MEKFVRKLKDKKTGAFLRIQSAALAEIHKYMEEKGVLQLTPVIISTITDPLSHDVFDARIEYYGQKLALTKSMILHKQLSLIGDIDAIYIVSPNIRLETKDKKHSGRHLIEFSQVDFEIKGATKEKIFVFVESMIKRIVTAVKKDCSDELELLGREIKTPAIPFKKYSSYELKEKYGKDFEKTISESSREPFWILDFDREFYDKEDPKRPGHFLNYDLVYPEGFGEGLSGGEREYEYERIIKRMKEDGLDLSLYAPYLEVAKKGLLRPSAGAGIGVERLVRYLGGAEDISETALFAKTPGEKILF